MQMVVSVAYSASNLHSSQFQSTITANAAKEHLSVIFALK